MMKNSHLRTQYSIYTGNVGALWNLWSSPGEAQGWFIMFRFRDDNRAGSQGYCGACQQRSWTQGPQAGSTSLTAGARFTT